MTHRLWVVSDLVALLEAEEGEALMEEDLEDDLEDLDDEPVGDWRKLLWYFALFSTVIAGLGLSFLTPLSS